MDPDAQVMMNAAFGLFPNAVGPGNIFSAEEILYKIYVSYDFDR